MMRTIRTLLIAGVVALPAAPAAGQNGNAIDGTWEGPWYRGMSSGLAKLQIAGGVGTLQLTNSETFGEEPRPLAKVMLRDDGVSFRADGAGGAPLSVDLKVNQTGDQMRGMGKYEGFGVRLELRRTGS